MAPRIRPSDGQLAGRSARSSCGAVEPHGRPGCRRRSPSRPSPVSASQAWSVNQSRRGPGQHLQIGSVRGGCGRRQVDAGHRPARGRPTGSWLPGAQRLRAQIRRACRSTGCRASGRPRARRGRPGSCAARAAAAGTVSRSPARSGTERVRGASAVALTSTWVGAPVTATQVSARSRITRPPSGDLDGRRRPRRCRPAGWRARCAARSAAPDGGDAEVGQPGRPRSCTVRQRPGSARRRSCTQPPAAKRTRLPGRSRAGGSRSRSHSGASVRPISCQPPGPDRG